MTADTPRLETDLDEAGAAPPADEAEAVAGRGSPLRRCVLTGVVQGKDGMIRFVIDPDGRVVPDLEERLPGRGYWLTAERGLLEQAVRRRAFSRAARRPVAAEADLADRVAGLLERRCLDTQGLARRAGLAVAGFEKVREALRRGPAAVLLEASDGADDGRAKLSALARDAPVIDYFDADRLGAAFGRDHTVHGMLKPGGLARRFLEECRRYAGFREGTETGIAVRRQPAGQRD